MILHYLRSVLRTLNRRRGYALLNIGGLAVGLACCVLIVLYVRAERSYDAHHAHADRIVRVTFEEADGAHWAPIAPPVGAAIAERRPEVEAFARFFPIGRDAVLRVGDARHPAPDGLYADASALDVFTFPVVAGTAEEALVRPASVVLTASFARRLFGTTDVVGRTIVRPGWDDLTVTAVIEDPPAATHLPFTHLISVSTFYAREPWLDQARDWSAFYTYLLLRTPDDRERLAAALPSFTDVFYEGFYDGPASAEAAFRLQPLREIHLGPSLEKPYRPGGDVLYVYLFGAVAALVLVVAVLNFVNLTTAQSDRRLREVGVRKTLGSSRAALAGGFLVESLVLGALGGVFAYVLAGAALPLLGMFASAPVTRADLHAPPVLAALTALALGAGLTGGLYPALGLARFHPVQALRGGTRGTHGATLRRGLVGFQFSLSIFLLAATAVVALQLQYVRGRTPGFDEGRVAKVSLTGETAYRLGQRLDGLRAELTAHPSVASVSLAGEVPGMRYGVEYVGLADRSDDEAVTTRIATGADHHYARTLGLGIVQGRDFSAAAPRDTAAFLVNRAAARRLGLEAPVGTRLRWGARDYEGPIVGVVEDFHYASLRDAVEPLVIPLLPGRGGTLLVRTEGDDRAALAHVAGVLDALAPGTPFDAVPLDDALDALYRSEARMGTVFGVFAGLAVLVACLGLFGLAAHTAERRRKEVGIRKVLGAGTGDVVGLLVREFALLVAAAFVVAAPLAYLASERWLDTFAYHVEPGPAPFLAAGAAALAAACLTVGYHALRAAVADPVHALRTD